MFNKRKFGTEGEQKVIDFLVSQDYQICETNYHVSFGEIDIIATSKGIYCFIEVKTRRSQEFGSGLEAVTTRKQNTIAKVAACYLQEHDLEDVDIRFDVVSVYFDQNDMQIDMLTNAFDAGF